MNIQIRKIRNSIVKSGIMTFMLIMLMTLCVGCKTFAAHAVTDDIMIRNDASREAGAIGSLQEDEEVTILDVVESGDGHVWYYIQLENGMTGYVRSDLIEVSDEELAAINSEIQEEPETEQEEEPTESGSTQESEDGTVDEENLVQHTQESETEATSAQTVDGEYDAAKDPEAHFSLIYDTDENGNGEWYLHNDDNGSKWKISDLINSSSNETAKSSQSVPIIAFLSVLLCVSVLINITFLRKKSDAKKEKMRKPFMCPVCGSVITEGVDYCPICGGKIDL